MPQIERFLPTSIKPKQGMAPGVSRPGVVLTDFSSGYKTSRDWGEISTRYLDIPVEMIGYATDGLRDFEAFLENVRVVGEVFWIAEPISGTHYGMTCGPLGDGSRTCFACPIKGAPISPVFMEDGVPNDSAIRHASANLFTLDGSCVPEDAGDFVFQNGSGDIKSFSNFGSTSLRVSQSAGGLHFLTCSELISASEGDDLTALASVFETVSGRSLAVGFHWYDGPTSVFAQSFATPADQDLNQWSILEHSETAPATTIGVKVALYSGDVTTGAYYLSGLAATPASYDRLHLPSMAPSVIEFPSAPAEGVRVTANATGKRMIRGRLGKNGVSWSMTDPGNAVPSSLSIMEEVEV